MPTLNKRCNTVVATIGTNWIDTANLTDGAYGSAPGTAASWVNNTLNGVGTIDAGFDFTDLPAGSTVSQTTVRFRHYVSSVSRMVSMVFQPFDGATAIGSPVTASMSTSLWAGDSSANFPATAAQLKSPTFVVRITGTRNAATNTVQMLLDFVDISVTYTAAPAAGGRPKVYVSGTWTAKPAKVWTGSAWVEKPVKVWTGSTWQTLT